jgi:two-component system NtrC family sensor kinase
LAVGTWELDLATGRSTCSPQLLRVYGITEHREDFTGDDWIQLVHPDDRERILTELQVSVESGVAPDRRHRAIWPDGSVHWIVTKSHVMLDANGQPSRIIGMDFDETLQMRTEERLRFLSSAVEQSPVSIVITDLHGNIEYVNRKATEITGYSMAELVGHNPRILKSGDKSPEEYTGIWETIRTGEWRGIFHNKKKNGELFWESAAISPIRDSSGKPTHYLAVKEDITERMAIEAALKTSEERFRLITETISEVFWMSDATLTRIFYISPAYENLWERSRESLYADPRSFMEPIHPEDLDRVRHEIESGRAAHQPFESEYRLVLPDGSTRSIRDRGFPVYDSDGRVSGYVGVALNVTDQKASEQANADLAAIVQSADSAIISKDLCGNVLTWNPGAERIFGYSAEEMIGRNITALIPADRIDEEAGIHATFLRGETTSHLETVRRTRSGNPISVLLTISPIRDGSGAVVGASQVAWNITEQKLLQRQLAQAQKLESIGQLAAGVAHEINTPIQYIGDNAKFLEEAFRDLARFVGPHREIAETFRRSREPGLAAALDRIYQEVDVDYLLEEVPKATRQLSEGVEQVARIVRAMKEFSHPGPVEKVPLDINRAIESTIVVSKNEWKYVADLTTDFDLGLPLVPSVAGEFNQVVLNLIVNAAHAIADVTKTTGGKGAIRISTRRSGEWAEVRVSDTGMGIPEAIRSNVFDPFFTTKEVGKGTGQGLSIAHAVIVKKHHGTFRFETEVGSGTTFILQLPLEASPAGETNSICL